jgi:hypothetical protein
MELALNLAWMVLAIAMCWLWVHHARREGPGHEMQFIALALVLVAMFVLITMYDDMAMAQNPAEARCFQQREDELGAHDHAVLHPVADLTPLFSAEPSFDSFHSAVPSYLLVPPLNAPATNSIKSRPPPTA